MSDNEETAEKPFYVDVAKQSRAACKKCKAKCMSGEVRIAKLAANPFGAGKMKMWHHVECIFELFLKQRPTTKRIESVDDMDGFDEIDKDDQEKILKCIEESEKDIKEKYNLKTSPKKPVAKPAGKSPKGKSSEKSPAQLIKKNEVHKDMSFREFRKLVSDITNVSSYTDKTALVSKLFTKGTDGVSFKGDIKLWCRLLLPGVVKRVYNLQSKQLIKLFSKIFSTNQNDMMEHLEQGDVAETIFNFFNESVTCKGASKSVLTLTEVDEFLQELSTLTKEDEQTKHFQQIIPKCTPNDLKVIIRLVKHDLRMNAGAKHILDGVHPDAYQAYQASRDIDTVIDRCLGNSSTTGKITQISLMTPVLPMLAEACKTIDQAMAKCPNGMYSEIKYDGERVQIHKEGNEFKYFSRSLKPVLPHKVAHLKHFISKAFPLGKDLILDSEILMIDVQSGKPLPFGTLGKHKKAEFKDANVCLFVFDCIYYNGKDLTTKPLDYRKQILKDNMTEIANHVVFSEMEEIHQSNDLRAMIAKVLQLGLEGLVLKDIKSIYEPGKRHWLKVKKDYLYDGAMADSADLIVLGAWYGTGKKGGMMSVFLMGCYDPRHDRFCTVTKVHTGHDDKTLEKLQNELDMVKLRDSNNQIPDWLHCTKTMIPDLIAKDPKKQPVWEVTGAEFTKHEVHTANGISIRFPRVTKIREDKHWDHATNLQELEKLFETSKTTDVSLLVKDNKKDEKKDIPVKPKLVETKRKSTDLSSPTKRKLSNSEGNPKKKINIDKASTSFVQEEKPAVNNLFIDDCDSSPKKKIKTERPSTSTLIEDETPTHTVSNLFKDIQLLVNEDAQLIFDDANKTFARHGGTILTTEQWQTATHVLHVRDTEESHMEIEAPVEARHIIVEWIKDSIDQNSLRDYKPYIVRLRGEDVPDDFFG